MDLLEISNKFRTNPSIR